MEAEKSSSKKQAWFCNTGLYIDIEIEVDDMTFHLHKFPLMSKSRKLHKLITEHEERVEDKRHEEEEEEENSYPHVRLDNFPGGSEIFEMVVKICYGIKVDLSATTAVPLRCAAENLEMTEEYSPDNLISKIQRFLSKSVLNNISKSVEALKACELVSPLAESLGITEQCLEAIVSLISIADPLSLFGWPLNAANPRLIINDEKKQSKESRMEFGVENLAELSLPIFKRVIAAMKSRDLSHEIVERSLIYYAKKHIPGISRSSSYSVSTEKQQRELLETIISFLPLHNSAITSSTTRSLFDLLRSAIILKTSETCRSLLEKKIGSQLEKATLDDLLIPSYSYLNETLYDIDLVERLICYFLENAAVSSSSLIVVGKLIDGVLGEIASDANLKPEKFYNLATSLPDQARVYDDGIYRAVDIYLKSHPWILEVEKEKISSVMNCQKLTLEGCTHAAQNERLPLRTIVQVLFFEQLHLRQAIAGMLVEDGVETDGEEEMNFGRWEETVRENQVLRLNMDTMRIRVDELERECNNMKKVIAMIDNGNSSGVNVGQRKWSISKKFGCKFNTQVCDSHEATMVDRISRPS